MANPVIPGDILQVVWSYDVFSQTCLNVMHYHVESAPAGTGYQEQIENFIALLTVDVVEEYQTEILAVLANDCRLWDITCQRVYPGRDYYVRKNINLAGTAVGGAALTANTSAVITKQSERTGRGRSGSWHCPGLPGNAIQAGEITGAFFIPLTALANAIKAPVRVGGVDPVIAYPGMFNPRVGAGFNFSKIVNTFVQDTGRVMRRRTVRVGI